MQKKWAVVKADAYSHGAVAVAQSIDQLWMALCFQY